MTKLPVVSGRAAIKAFAKAGYVVDRQKGSHVVLRHRDPPHRRLTVPEHPVLAKVRFRAPIRDAGLTVEAFVALL